MFGSHLAKLGLLHRFANDSLCWGISNLDHTGFDAKCEPDMAAPSGSSVALSLLSMKARSR